MNVNGHMVTKWVLPDSEQDESSRIPGPVAKVSTPAATIRVAKRLKSIIKYQHMTVPSEIKFEDIEESLLGLPLETVKFIDEVSEASETDYYLDCLMISALYYGETSRIDDIVHVYTEIDPELGGDITQYSDWGATGFDGETIIRGVLSGLETNPVPGMTYKCDEVEPLRLREDGSSSKALAVYNVIDFLEAEFSQEQTVKYSGGGSAWIGDEKLAALVVENHDRNDEVMNIMRERETADPEIISMILGAEHKALQNGVL